MTQGFVNPNATGRLKASYELLEPLEPARCDLPLFVRVRVRNEGTVVWPDRGAYPVHLSYHWLDADDRTLDWDGVRADLPGPLAPGEAAEIELRVEPPPRPGDLKLQIDLVEENVGWFSMQSVWPLILSLRAEPAPRYVGRACVIGPLCLVNDAVGNAMVDQLRTLQARGYEAAVVVEFIDDRQPRGVRRHMLELKLNELKSGEVTALTRRPLDFFQTADLFIFNYPLPYQLFDAIQMVERGVVVVDYHGVTPPELWDGEGRDAYVGAVRRQMGLLRHADYAIAHSAYTHAELLRAAPIAPERVSRMAYAVPLERFTPGPKPPALLERYGLRPDQPTLLYVGRMATNKRIADLVRALTLVRAALPDATLLLVGDDRPPTYAPVVARARALAARLGVADRVIVAGMVPDAELPDHYRLADVFVTASVHEGFCIPVIEAMACGIPVVGAHATALPETIGDGGLTFAPENAEDLANNVLMILGVTSHESRVRSQKTEDRRQGAEAQHLAPARGQGREGDAA